MDDLRSFEPSETRNRRKTIMQVLTSEEIELVSGGDSWAGTPEGRAPWEPLPDTFPGCMVQPETVRDSKGEAVIAALICGGKKLQQWSSDYIP